MKTDINQRNHLLRWGVLSGVVAMAGLITIVLYIDFDLLRDPHALTDGHLRFLLICLSIILTSVIVRQFIKSLAAGLNKTYLKRFKEIHIIGAYNESLSKFFIPEKKYEHIVLLLHGFAASPQEFTLLEKHLKDNNIPYITPIIPGFGVNYFDTLAYTRHEDWFRLALSYYDNLSLIAERVSIVGHSMGAILATFVAQQRKVEKLVLSGPGLYPAKRDWKYQNILLMPIVSSLFSWLFPYLPKPIRKGRKTTSDTLDISMASKVFQYMAVPTRAIQEIFMAQKKIKPSKIKATSILLLYGKHDLTVSIEDLLESWKNYHVVFTEKCFKNTAHNVFEDYEREEACKDTVNFLNNRENSHGML